MYTRHAQILLRQQTPTLLLDESKRMYLLQCGILIVSQLTETIRATYTCEMWQSSLNNNSSDIFIRAFSAEPLRVDKDDYSVP